MKKLLLILLCLPMIGFGQQTYVPDDNFEAYLEANGMGNGIANDDSVFTSAIDTVTYLGVHNQNIADLTGIEAFTALTNLNVTNNQLTSLDVSQNIALIYLQCQSNQLTTLDVSANTALTYLGSGGNLLTSLDVSQNTALTYLWCNNNLLTSLDVRNGNNSLLDTNFFCTGNPNLTCIDVDDASWSTANWPSIDTHHYFSNNCSATSLQEHTTNKELLKVTDILGRETKQTNQPLLYLYDDGTVEKRMTID